MTKEEKQCEVCGGAATVAVRGIKQSFNFKTGYKNAEPDGMIHYFCDDHQKPCITEMPPAMSGLSALETA